CMFTSSSSVGCICKQASTNRHSNVVARNRGSQSISSQWLRPMTRQRKFPLGWEAFIASSMRDGIDIDIGCSKSDVRGRISTKWRHEKDAASVLVYVLKSESECLHWERLFQKRFETRSGRLSRYCEVRGKGCGCPTCS